MIINVEVLKSGGTCSISNVDVTDILRYEFRIIEKDNSFTLEFRNKNQEEARKEGEWRARFQKTRHRSKTKLPSEINWDKVHLEVVKFLLQRWI